MGCFLGQETRLSGYPVILDGNLRICYYHVSFNHLYAFIILIFILTLRHATTQKDKMHTCCDVNVVINTKTNAVKHTYKVKTGVVP